DNVVGKTGKNHFTRHVLARSVLRSVEVAKEQRDLLRRVIGILLPKRVRMNSETLHEDRVLLRTFGVGRWARTPKRGATKRLLEVMDGETGDGVNHLLVEL